MEIRPRSEPIALLTKIIGCAALNTFQAMPSISPRWFLACSAAGTFQFLSKLLLTLDIVDRPPFIIPVTGQEDHFMVRLMTLRHLGRREMHMAQFRRLLCRVNNAFIL